MSVQIRTYWAATGAVNITPVSGDYFWAMPLAASLEFTSMALAADAAANYYMGATAISGASVAVVNHGAATLWGQTSPTT